jgi:uncharacterized OB-fold protein
VFGNRARHDFEYSELFNSRRNKVSSEFVPEPPPDDLSEQFWRAGLEGQIRLQECDECHHIRFPLSTICPRCLSEVFHWTDLSGNGQVQSFIRFHRAYDPSWADAVPYVVALVDLDEGPTLVSNIVGVGSGNVAVGDVVRVVFDKRSDVAALPQFQLTVKG